MYMSGKICRRIVTLSTIRSNSIYIWRIIFTILIMVMHFDNIYSTIYSNPYVTDGWFISVEFFFLVAGFLLASHLEHQQHPESAIQYTLGRFKRLFPEYLFALLVPCLLMLVTGGQTIKGTILTFMENWEELFMLQCVGLNRFPFLSNVTWYLSVMLIVGYFCFLFLSHYKKFYLHAALPLLIIVSYSYLFRHAGYLDTWIYTDSLWLNEGIIRGTLDMNLGILAYYVYQNIRQKQWTKTGRFILLFIEVLCYCFVIFMSLRHAREYDFCLLALLTLAVPLSFMNQFFVKFHTCKFIKYLNELTYPVYLNHNLWNGWILPKIFPTTEWHLSWVILYVILVFLYSALTHFIVLKCWALAKNFTKKIFVVS